MAKEARPKGKGRHRGDRPAARERGPRARRRAWCGVPRRQARAGRTTRGRHHRAAPCRDGYAALRNRRIASFHMDKHAIVRCSKDLPLLPRTGAADVRPPLPRGLPRGLARGVRDRHPRPRPPGHGRAADLLRVPGPLGPGDRPQVARRAPGLPAAPDPMLGGQRPKALARAGREPQGLSTPGILAAPRRAPAAAGASRRRRQEGKTGRMEWRPLPGVGELFPPVQWVGREGGEDVAWVTERGRWGDPGHGYRWQVATPYGAAFGVRRTPQDARRSAEDVLRVYGAPSSTAVA